MNLEQQVVNLELARRLKALNVKQESLFNWLEGIIVYGHCGHKGNDYVSAFTVAELGEMLPSTVSDHFWKYETNWYEKCIQYKDDGQNLIAEINDKNEANARAKMLIHLLEQGLIKNQNTYT